MFDIERLSDLQSAMNGGELSVVIFVLPDCKACAGAVQLLLHVEEGTEVSCRFYKFRANFELQDHLRELSELRIRVFPAIVGYRRGERVFAWGGAPRSEDEAAEMTTVITERIKKHVLGDIMN